ncbi:MAG: thioredoxin [Candidatus Pacearchaeota archaeon]|jgi:thioredoxin
MALKHLTLENYEREIENSKLPVVVDFYADWCGPCQMMAPVFESLSTEFKGKMNFLKLDTSEEEMLSVKFGVQGIPTLVFMNKGKEISRHVGYAPGQMLKSKISEVLKKIK